MISDLILRLMLALDVPALMAKEDIAQAGADVVDQASKTINLVFMVVGVAVLLLVGVFVAFKIMGQMQNANPKTMTEETVEKINNALKKTDFVGAAEGYEALMDHKNAALYYEKARAFKRAAPLYEELKNYDKAFEMYRKGNDAKSAGFVLIKAGRHMDAAKLFQKMGDRLNAAVALEKMGNYAAAAREYGAAGQYMKAARLYKDEGMYQEAGLMYYRTFAEEDIYEGNLDKYYTFAAFLVMAGDNDRASDIYTGILSVDPEYRDVKSKLRALGMGGEVEEAPEAQEAQPAPEESGEAKRLMQQEIDDMFASLSAQAEVQATEEKTEAPEPAAAGASRPHESTLAELIGSGGLDINESLRLGMQMMRSLYDLHGSGIYMGSMEPAQIFVNAKGSVKIGQTDEVRSPYAAPEVIAGQDPDEQSDVYSVGVIMFEMLTGSTEGLGERGPRQINRNVPDWLDELVTRLTDPNRGMRFRDLGEPSSIIMRKSS